MIKFLDASGVGEIIPSCNGLLAQDTLQEKWQVLVLQLFRCQLSTQPKQLTCTTDFQHRNYYFMMDV